MQSIRSSTGNRLRDVFDIFCACVVAISPLALFVTNAALEFFRYPVAVAVTPATSEVGINPLFALISDSHITDRTATLENFRGGTPKLRATLSAIRSAAAQHILLLGDLTDRGEDAEWNIVDTVFAEHFRSSSTAPTVWMVPGNHDLQGSPQEGVLEALGTSDAHNHDISFLKRVKLFFYRATKLQGGLLQSNRAPVVASDVARIIGKMLDGLKDGRKVTVNTYRTEIQGIGQQRMQTVVTTSYTAELERIFAQSNSALGDAFPMTHLDTTNGIALVLLNSSIKPSPGTSMGLGNLGVEQLDRLDKLVDVFVADRTLKKVLVAVHHAPVRRESDAWSFTDLLLRLENSDVYAHTFLALDVLDAERLVAVLERLASKRADTQVVIAYGHRHGCYFGRTAGGVWIVEAPSVVEEKETAFWAMYPEGNPGLSWHSSSECRSR